MAPRMADFQYTPFPWGQGAGVGLALRGQPFILWSLAGTARLPEASQSPLVLKQVVRKPLEAVLRYLGKQGPPAVQSWPTAYPSAGTFSRAALSGALPCAGLRQIDQGQTALERDPPPVSVVGVNIFYPQGGP